MPPLPPPPPPVTKKPPSLLHQLLRPLHYLFDRLVEPVVRRVGGSSGEAEDPLSTETVLRVARSTRAGAPDGTPLAIMGKTAGAAEMKVCEGLAAVEVPPSPKFQR